MLGLTIWTVCAGRKEIGLDVASIRPSWLVAIGAVGLLALGKPISGDRRWPDDLSVTLPGIKCPGFAQVNVSVEHAACTAFTQQAKHRLLPSIRLLLMCNGNACPIKSCTSMHVMRQVH